MKNEKDEITIKSIWKWLRSDKGKRYSFFLFYLFFFIIIFIFLSYREEEVVKENKEDVLEKEEYSNLPFKTSLFDEDYTFTYSINYNNETSDYLGRKNKEKVILNDDRGTYNYIYQNGILIYQGINEPINYKEFLDCYEIKRIIKNSKLISETKLNQTGEYLYKYSITTRELYDLYDKIYNNLENLDNEIIVKTNLNNEITSINLNVLNYVKNDILDVKTYEIIITYGDKDE